VRGRTKAAGEPTLDQRDPIDRCMQPAGPANPSNVDASDSTLRTGSDGPCSAYGLQRSEFSYGSPFECADYSGTMHSTTARSPEGRAEQHPARAADPLRHNHSNRVAWGNVGGRSRTCSKVPNGATVGGQEHDTFGSPAVVAGAVSPSTVC